MNKTTYELVKTYPGSPAIGTKVTVPTDAEFAFDGKLEKFKDWEEFWQPVQKNYEILSYTKEDGDCTIRSIKRRSDGAVFTVGDHIETEFGGTCIMYDFIVRDGNLCIGHTHGHLLDRKYPELEYGQHLELIQPVKNDKDVTHTWTEYERKLYSYLIVLNSANNMVDVFADYTEVMAPLFEQKSFKKLLKGKDHFMNS